MKKLTQKEEEMLYDYERKFGKEKADEWREKLLAQTEDEAEIVEKEIEETEEIEPELEEKPQEPEGFMHYKEGFYAHVPDDIDPEEFKKLWNVFIRMINEVQNSKYLEGYVYLLNYQNGILHIESKGKIVVPSEED